MNRTVATKELTLSCGHKTPLSQYEGDRRAAFCQRCAYEVGFTLTVDFNGNVTVDDATARVEVQKSLLVPSKGWFECRVTVKVPKQGRGA